MLVLRAWSRAGFLSWERFCAASLGSRPAGSSRPGAPSRGILCDAGTASVRTWRLMRMSDAWHFDDVGFAARAKIARRRAPWPIHHAEVASSGPRRRRRRLHQTTDWEDLVEPWTPAGGRLLLRQVRSAGREESTSASSIAGAACWIVAGRDAC